MNRIRIGEALVLLYPPQNSDLVETQPNTVGRLAALKALAHLESDIGLLQLGR